MGQGSRIVARACALSLYTNKTHTHTHTHTHPRGQGSRLVALDLSGNQLTDVPKQLAHIHKSPQYTNFIYHIVIVYNKCTWALTFRNSSQALLTKDAHAVA